MPRYDRFKQALTQIDGSQWRLFEILAQAFMADEYPSMRPMASMSGDDGLDATLFQPSDNISVAIQYSVRKDWAAKIRQTCSRLRTTAPATTVLVYVTNQPIGPSANTLKREITSSYRIYVDIRDQEWLLANRNAGSRATAEADEYCDRVLSAPRSPNDDIIGQAAALDDLESKAAFVYLNLQWKDDTREKGLTKLCFDAVTRAVLRDTTSENRMPRTEIYSQAHKLLPAHHGTTLETQIDGSLKRLSKVHIRHWVKPDEFCLTWEERTRLASRLDEMAVLDSALTRSLTRIVSVTAQEAGFEISADDVPVIVARSRKVLERVLLDRGEVFASAVANDRGAYVRFEDVEAVVYRDITMRTPLADYEPRLVASAVQSLLASPDDEAREYLRGLADTYTLFAFMRETPDVQSAIVKIFSDGDIWLDTTVALPLLAEELLDQSARKHTLIFAATIEAHSRLYVTPGVVNELAAHINRCRAYGRSLDSEAGAFGPMPFLLAAFRTSDKSPDLFENWLEYFCGTARPEDDLSSYLLEIHRIETRDLQKEIESADPKLVAAVNEIWQESRDWKDQRSVAQGGIPMDAGTRIKLIQHDVENYVGVISRRELRHERKSAFGYKTWWLTLDGTARRMESKLREWMSNKPPASPAISPDFMIKYLAIGPARARLSRKTEEALPLMMNMQVLDAVPPELLSLADSLRSELVDLPPHVVSRKIRDTLDEARSLLGPLGLAGDKGLNDDVMRRLVAQAKSR